jgi:decaprenyl-phosphate phosphoribosyltransferase
MRPKQWLKNVLVFLAPLRAPCTRAASSSRPSVLAKLCLVASGLYLINDLRDVEADRAPTKSKRPIAAGLVPVPLALVAAAVLVPGGIVLGWLGAD